MTNHTPLQTITEQDTSWDEYAQDQLENEERDNRNLLIAARVLRYLRENNRSKRWLAGRLGISPQRVGVILKGRGNMTLDSIADLERATGLTLLTVPRQQPMSDKAKQTIWGGRIALASSFITANILGGKPTKPSPAH